MDRVKVINQKCTSLKIQLTQLANYVTSGRYDETNLKKRLNRVTELLHAYEELHDELAIIDPSNERLGDLENIQDRYYDIATRIDTMGAAGPSSVSVNAPLNSTVLNTTLLEGRRTLKLPVAELPKFDGSIDKWLSFKNAFMTMIDERIDITDLEKFLYLKNSLRGDALNKILLFNASAENYQNAWRLLVDSYERRRILVSKHLDAILHIESPAKITSSGIVKLIDEVRQHLNMLQTLGVTPDENMIVRVLENALPNEIRQKWEESLSLDTLPTLEQFYKFINETSFRLLTVEQNAGRDKPDAGIKRRSNRELRAVKTRKGESGARIFATSIADICSYCKQRHYISSCPTFGKLTLPQRWDVVKRQRWCRNCLRDHRGPCKSKSCKHCGRFHHSLLHRFETQNPSAIQPKSSTETAGPSNSV